MESFEGQIVSDELARWKHSKEFGQISLQFACGGSLPLRQYYIIGYSFPDEVLTSTYLNCLPKDWFYFTNILDQVYGLSDSHWAVNSRASNNKYWLADCW